ncbi:MAG: FMN-binding negative transcriptional regulator [Luteimonas sp.]
MYLPRHYADTDLAQLDGLIASNPFVTLVTGGTDGHPFASHLPVLYRRDDGHLLIEGHWARPNPQARHCGDALMIVHGPHAYISPGWYPDKEAAARVPTWNYAVAHLHGSLETFDDPSALADLVSRLSAHFEAAVGSDWQFEPGREDHVSQLRGIIGFRFVAERIELKFKLNQNHPAENMHAVAAALSQQEDRDANAIASMMLARARLL